MQQAEMKAYRRETRELAAALMTDGKFKRAAQVLSALPRQESEDVLINLEFMCALAGAGRQGPVLSGPGSYDPSSLSREERARLLTAQAFAAPVLRKKGDRERKLEMAIDLDPTFAPSHNALGRYLLYQQKQYDQARDLLATASFLSPQSLGPRLDLASLDVETRDFGSAFNRVWLLVLEHPWDLRAWASLISTGILMLPWSGLPLGLALSLLVFVPYAGPIVFTLWVITSLGIPVLLRRVGGRMAVSAASLLFPMTPTLLLRWLLLGRIWP